MQLPRTSLPMPPNAHVSRDEKAFYSNEETDQLVDMVERLIGGDCKALVVNGDAIWNDYVAKSVKERLEESLLGAYVVEHLKDLLLFQMHRDGAGEFDIYMFGAHPWRVNVRLSAANDGYDVAFFASAAYCDLVESGQVVEQ